MLPTLPVMQKFIFMHAFNFEAVEGEVEDNVQKFLHDDAAMHDGEPWVDFETHYIFFKIHEWSKRPVSFH